jgi:hypothetical protein
MPHHSPQPGTGAKHAASSSHLANDEYLERFEQAHAAMAALTADPGSPYFAPSQSRNASSNEQRLPPGRLHVGGLPFQPRVVPQVQVGSKCPSTSRSGAQPNCSNSTMSATSQDHYASAVTAGWQTGPSDPAGRFSLSCNHLWVSTHPGIS